MTDDPIFFQKCKTKLFAIPKAYTRYKTERGFGIIFFRADNYAVAKEISVNKYCTKAS